MQHLMSMAAPNWEEHHEHDPAGWAAFMRAVAGLPSLTNADVYRARLNTAAAALAPAVARLTTPSLANCELDDAVLAALLDGGLGALRRLDVSHNAGLTAVSLEAIQEAATPTLGLLNAGGASASAWQVAQLRAALPACHVPSW